MRNVDFAVIAAVGNKASNDLRKETMETKKLTDIQIALLKKPLPDEAIKPHPTRGYLSTIKPIFVVERLNDVFGIGEWRVENTVEEHTAKMVVVKAVLTVPACDIRVEQYGGNDNEDRGDAFKGAATDALTKCASYLGIGMDVYKGEKPHTPEPKRDEPKKVTTKKVPPEQASEPKANGATYVDEITSKSDVSKKTGKPYTIFHIKLSNGMDLQTFNSGYARVAEDAKDAGHPVDVTYETKEYNGRTSYDLTSITEVQPQAETKNNDLPF